jgi:hypothetical protein
MPSSKFTHDQPSGAPNPVVREEQIEYGFIDAAITVKESLTVQTALKNRQKS